MNQTKADAKEQEKKRQRVLLKQYLGQYYSAKRVKQRLEKRLQVISEEMGSIRGMNYSPIPSGKTNAISDGPISGVIRKMEVEERIENQKDEMAKAMLSVMAVMDFLPVNSEEREVLELRHIDCMSWKQICKEINLTRTPCNNRYDKGIDRLLEFKKVQKIIKDFEKKQEKDAETSD